MKGTIESNTFTVKELTKEPNSLRTGMSTLKVSLSQCSKPKPLERSTGVSNKELNILTDNVAPLGDRASQVETLQMQFEILKGHRVERMDNKRLTASVMPAHPSDHRKRPHPGVQEVELLLDQTCHIELIHSTPHV